MTDMSMHDVAQKVHTLGHAWEQFKQVNDRRLGELERKGSADTLYDAQLRKINEALDATKAQMQAVEAAMHRPVTGENHGVKNHAAAEEHKQAFCSYVRKGADAGLAGLESKALSASSDPDGGYLVTHSMSQHIAKKLFEVSPLRQLARVEAISTDALEIIEDYNDIGAGWTSETGTVSDTTTPAVGKRTIVCHEIYAQPKATQKLVDDSAIDIEQWLAEKLADKFSRLENAAFINGDGVGKPRGILTYASGISYGQIQQVNSGTDGEVDADALLKLFYALKEAHAARAHFLMHRSTLQKVRLLKETSTGQYIWTPFLGQGQPETLLGLPVHSAVDMPVPAEDSLSVALGDFEAAYQIIDREGIRILRDPYTEKPFVKFYATSRVGGDVVNFDAVKLLKLAN